MSHFETEVSQGERFQFGKNWSRFLRVLNDTRIKAAESSLREFLGVEDLRGMSFLDIGSGTGLFSLAARRLGARVHSFDFDPQSVACTRELRRRYYPDDIDWRVEQASVLDREYLDRLGQFDVVYSWGVLHHTGAMWDALGNISDMVADGGRMFISIYNDQGSMTRRWKAIKQLYNRLPWAGKWALVVAVGIAFEIPGMLRRLTRLQNPLPFKTWREARRGRGMSKWYDLVDWVGGYPFEVAKPEEIFCFYRDRGYTLRNLTTCGGGLGCNQYLFVREGRS